MRALVLEEIGKLNVKEVEGPGSTLVNSEGDTIITVKACGICGSDIPRAYVNGAHRMPLIIGHEFAGVTEDGRPVGIFPLIPCRKCGPCKMGKYEMCRSYNYLGSRCDGGFAEKVSVPTANLIELPEGVDFSEAAMLEPMAVAVHACRKAGVIEGSGNAGAGNAETDEDLGKTEALDSIVAICGAGTIGLLILMFLIDKGYKNIVVIGNRDIQKEKAISLGLNEKSFIDSRTEEGLNAIKGLNADIFFECVGKQETYAWAIDHTAPAGRVCLVGNPYSDMELPRDIYWKILRNQLTVTGTWNSSFTGSEDDDWHYVVSRLAQGAIHPAKLITHRFGLQDIVKGFEIMRDKSEDYIKIMMQAD